MCSNQQNFPNLNIGEGGYSNYLKYHIMNLAGILKRFLSLILVLFIFMGYYFILSSIVLLFGYGYIETISNLNWFITYSLLIGWWLTWITIFEID